MEQYIDKDALVVELKKRISNYWSDSENTMGIYPYALEEVIKYVDSLEVKEMKEPTASDKGMAEEIIINLKRVEQDYHIDLTREMEWLRRSTER